MKIPDLKKGKIFLVFAGICIMALPIVVLTAFSYDKKEIPRAAVEPARSVFDNNSGSIFEKHDQMAKEYLEGVSTGRTLNEYYERRQYPGSPPYIPHKLLGKGESGALCLSCHEKGGWSDELKRNTPLTPHPEFIACRQCHVPKATEDLFVTSGWLSVAPPRLGRSHLPGGPPPIPHPLQLRENCVPCHVGPGSVEAIRVDHPSRGNCRQCHVPDLEPGRFMRKSDY